MVWLAMARAAEWLETSVGLDVERISRGGLDRKDCFTLRASGAHLAYIAKLDGGWVFFSAQPMDSGGEAECLLRAANGPEGWSTICRLVRSLERSGSNPCGSVRLNSGRAVLLTHG
jgi:hypothetical protein